MQVLTKGHKNKITLLAIISISLFMNVGVKTQKMENMPGALPCWEGSTVSLCQFLTEMLKQECTSAFNGYASNAICVEDHAS
jgi:hypothetical protein